MKRFVPGLGCLALLLGVAGQAGASLISGSVWANQEYAAQNPSIAEATTLQNTVGNPTATFTMNSGPADTPINLYNNANPTYTIDSFLKSNNNGGLSYQTGAGDAAATNSLAQAYFLFTGSVFLNAGDNSLTITHDDGFELSITGGTISGFPTTPPTISPTAKEVTNGTVNVATAGFYNFTLSYGETNGPPAILEFQVNAAPEPSTMISGGMGLLAGLGWTWSRRRRAKAAA